MVYLLSLVLGLVGLFTGGFKEMLYYSVVPFGYVAITYFENKVFYITSLENYFWWKLILKPIISLFVGPFAAPVIIIKDLYNFYISREQTAE